MKSKHNFTRKQAQKKAIFARLHAALADMYHNATPRYPSLDEADARRFESWFNDAAQWEIEYMQNGGATGTDYRATLAAPCNAGKLKSDAARRRYVAKGLRDRDAEREDCGMLTGWRVLELHAGNMTLARALAPQWKVATTPGGSGARLGVKLPARVLAVASRNDARWERISEFGKLYTYGRGGRTLAPDELVRQRGGGSFSVREIEAADHGTPYAVDMLRVIESFNRVVSQWCASVPEQWAEVEAERIAEEKREANRARAAKARETRERKFWAARGMVTQ